MSGHIFPYYKHIIDGLPMLVFALYSEIFFKSWLNNICKPIFVMASCWDKIDLTTMACCSSIANSLSSQALFLQLILFAFWEKEIYNDQYYQINLIFTWLHISTLKAKTII